MLARRTAEENAMDDAGGQPQALVTLWERYVTGVGLVGFVKLLAYLAGFVLVFGLVFAFIT
jgi:hypothetical protein